MASSGCLVYTYSKRHPPARVGSPFVSARKELNRRDGEQLLRPRQARVKKVDLFPQRDDWRAQSADDNTNHRTISSVERPAASAFVVPNPSAWFEGDFSPKWRNVHVDVCRFVVTRAPSGAYGS